MKHADVIHTLLCGTDTMIYLQWAADPESVLLYQLNALNYHIFKIKHVHHFKMYSVFYPHSILLGKFHVPEDGG